MNCYYHAEKQAIAFCRSCGHPVCEACQRLSGGTVYCPEHAPVVDAGVFTPEAAAHNPYVQPPAAVTSLRTSPGLAFVLGFIPGVGAIYNGQYLKGLVHAVVFGLLVSILSSTHDGSTAPFLGILLAAFVFYMPFEAFHTARQRRAGLPVDEWSSFAPVATGARRAHRGSLGPVILIGIGVLFLLDTMNLMDFRLLGRFWPVLLIVGGAYMLYNRTAGSHIEPPQAGTPYVPPPVPSNAGRYAEGRREQ